METPAAPRGGEQASAAPIRVFIVTDHELVRQGLRELFEDEGFEIVGEGSSAAEAIRSAALLQPDIAVLDDRLPDGTGIEVCRALRSRTDPVTCLLLSGYDEDRAARATVLGGASGYVLKQVGDNTELANAVRRAARGTILIRPALRERIAERLKAAAATSLGTMTTREREVLFFMATGMTNRQIEQKLILPGQVIAGCVSSVLEGLGFARSKPAYISSDDEGLF
ncbi:response regulator receiver protein [Pseudarthrobacter chlorophenolicus A6]|uniref:Response regulator receiver protein n=1 Tax=Pseudarthrobacter chlorophenolicus (strain ATCC 700700 / DSM 12829 / CIP 107037 / JCM 12360 / KCTC 9906 / NCIMB 13794 / A6) TaxID=452863 RepID=B8H6W5_PSECP|nr:response regulator transcription factor [Pseudarthrobacter chlorophenolicus]ACL39686.1 response regulator receiver protein [Pseudarthrobacter chlorophenolicus A6]